MEPGTAKIGPESFSGNSIRPLFRVINFLVAIAVLSGYYMFRVLVFKVGLYNPIISFAPES